MKKLIGVVDLADGTITERGQDSLTLDIPSDLDPATGSVAVNADQIGKYLTAAGENRVYRARPSFLSGRAPGEECLVAAGSGEASGEAGSRQFRVAMVDVDD
jgi:hypothetical protein